MTIRPKKLEFDYEKEPDVLYISLGKPRAADDSVEPQDGVVVRSRKGEVVGITIVGLSRKLGASLIRSPKSNA